MKNFIDTVWNRNRDLLALSSVPKPTAPSREFLHTASANLVYQKEQESTYVNCFLILIPCIIDYVEVKQPNALKLYTFLFYLKIAPTCFGKTMPSSGSGYFPV
jgi:hypothetical protein